MLVNDMIVARDSKVVNRIRCAPGMFILSLLLGFGLPSPTGLGDSIADTPFVQEYHQAYTVGADSAGNDVRAIAVDGFQNVWIIIDK